LRYVFVFAGGASAGFLKKGLQKIRDHCMFMQRQGIIKPVLKKSTVKNRFTEKRLTEAFPPESARFVFRFDLEKL
jgi:hypothetical protein